MIEEEDTAYFKKRDEDLSPQSKRGKAIVLYSSDNEEVNNEIINTTPFKTRHQKTEEEEHEFSFHSPPQFMSPILNLENRREDFFFSPMKPSSSAKRKTTPPTPQDVDDLSFLSPIRNSSTHSNTVSPGYDSPIMTPDSKMLKTIRFVGHGKFTELLALSTRLELPVTPRENYQSPRNWIFCKQKI